MEQIVKSWIRVGSGGNSKKSDFGTQNGYHSLFTPNFMFCFIRSGSGRVGYIPEVEKLGLGRVPENSGARSTTTYNINLKKVWNPNNARHQKQQADSSKRSCVL